MGSTALQIATVLMPPLRGLLGTTLLLPADALAVGVTAGLPYLAIEAMKRPAAAVLPSRNVSPTGSAS